MQKQAVRRGVDHDDRGQAYVDDRTGVMNEYDGQRRATSDLGLRPGDHYPAADDQRDLYADAEPQEYDPRAYAPNPDEPYGYDADGNPLYYESYDERRVRSGRSGMVLVAAVLGVALLGGGGVYAYRMMSHGGFGGEPPLIKAETDPVKTVPDAPAATDTHQNKQIYDRVEATAPAKSKVVSREEQPVELPASPTSTPRADGARVILPGGPAAAEPTAPSTMGSEPRRVKTVEIRPDGGFGGAPAPAQPQAAAPANDPIGQAAATGQAPAGEFDNGIMNDGSAAAPAREQTAAVPVPRPRPAAPAQAAAPRPAAPAQTAARPAAPAQTQQPVAPPQQQVAAVAPRAQVPATAPRPSASGGFVVQVTSQRSEADARAAYAALQRKFPGVLGQYGANIQSANVGDRGTYYRVRVGPFADGGQASTLCNNLRSAGGDCVVSRN
ncbi:hypothetical protein JOD31_000625 [Methylopila capsulata]|uniref:SPOR domain-containing protein n=1 Tax=Methylopila capsulata TaxID=61654 RepID=A0A9W6MS63_9HYPH|nr:SPOR domain-containing protein [Methylopila capsulata]MBM7850413.1 hypothetical protein [Methylopila capsulata]GLK55706.1 hypothetical protein GCM10008170_17250 [Methylopila capsulata]